MKITSESIITQIVNIERIIDNLLDKHKFQENEISLLKIENKRLRENYAKTLEEIQEYVKQLEQIKSHYVNSNNNIK